MTPGEVRAAFAMYPEAAFWNHKLANKAVARLLLNDDEFKLLAKNKHERIKMLCHANGWEAWSWMLCEHVAEIINDRSK